MAPTAPRSWFLHQSPHFTACDIVNDDAEARLLESIRHGEQVLIAVLDPGLKMAGSIVISPLALGASR
ncbi:MAG: hypothetical protein IPF41_04370 [Flavobacteriales bacterium]|nr:hypothetical protein [Flavobacteriales bacterium]